MSCWLSLASRAFGAATDFWNKKQPSAWTTDEVLLLTTRSPWAKDTRVDLKAKGLGAAGEQGGADPVRDPTTGGFRGGSGGGRTGGKAPNVTVTWESAQPLFDALKYQIPANFVNHYVIGVKDLPILVDAGPQRESAEQLVDWLKNSATLRVKSRDAVEAGVVATTRGGSMVLFGFLKELLPLSANDKEVLFTLDTNQLAIRAKFEPKEMIYRGKLAL
ncbi:MAG: hypothetical protein ABSG41_14680 [Bryobacteraceae bacterium]|jgi:hypothetical protein